MATSESDRQIVQQIRDGDAAAWQRCIEMYEGRLLAFARNRLQDRSAAEDIVQETFLGFLKALPNYDDSTPLESWLFSIASHKLIDLMRRCGRRPVLPLAADSSPDGVEREITGPGRAASSLMRSQERASGEAFVVADCLRKLIAEFRNSGAWERLCCVELIFVLGWPNKDVATRLGISEQAVANHKFFVVNRLKDAARAARLTNTSLDGMGLD